MANTDLSAAKLAKKDEFYTQLCDIEAELCHYVEFFRGKTVLCNCDDPYESNFFYYFASRFNDLGLKKLICTCYDGSPIAYTQPDLFGGGTVLPRKKRKAYKITVTEVGDENHDGAVDIADVAYLIKNRKNVLVRLKGNGDFRSPECVELLKEADVVVTNPPFSLFREFVAQLIAFKKKFLIIGTLNAVHYKECFQLISRNEMWLGASIHSGDREFEVPEDYPLEAAGSRIDDKGRRYIRVKGIRWFTNLDFRERHEDLVLVRTFDPAYYPVYDNYEAIEINSTKDIPCDYDGDMGVPDTFLDKYNPDQFELVGLGAGDLAKQIGVKKNYRGRTDIAFTVNGKHKCPYSRIIIRRKRK